VTGALPYSFENFTRDRVPPIETQTICLRVLLVGPGGGGGFDSSVSWGPAAHVATQ